MKHTSKHNDGFTLVELVVAIAISVIVTAAATSVLLMGLRINRQTGDTASQQVTVRTLLSTVDSIISEGNISDIEMQAEAWRIRDKDEKVLLSYLYNETDKSGSVYVGDYNALTDTDEGTTATPILTNLLSSSVEMYDGLFTIHVETKDGLYSSSVLCRSLSMGVGEHDDTIKPNTDDAKRTEFIRILKTQYRSRGQIREAGIDTETYYSEWYCGGNYWPGWNEKTPWCACYISWALSPLTSSITNPPKNNIQNGVNYWFANVDEFMDYFRNNTQESTWEISEANGGDYSPIAGDLIFFDWNKGDNPQHVGVVLSVSEDGRRVYTIEGNSAGRVTVRSYPLNDQRIIGYGVLWPENS